MQRMHQQRELSRSCTAGEGVRASVAMSAVLTTKKTTKTTTV